MSVLIPEIIKGGMTTAEILAGLAAGAGATVAAGGIATGGYPKDSQGYYIPQYDPSRGGYFLPGYPNAITAGMILPGGKVFNPPTYAPGQGVLAPSGSSGGVRAPLDDFQPYNATREEIKKGVSKIIGSSSDSIIKYRYPRNVPSNIKSIKDSITNNPKFINDIIDIIGKDTIPKNITSDDIVEIIKKDSAKQKAILDALQGLKLPQAPNFKLGTDNTTQTGQPDDDSTPPEGDGSDATISVDDGINKVAVNGEGTKGGDLTKTSGKNESTDTKTETKTDTKTETKTQTKTETKTEDDDEEPKPPREPPEPKDKDKEKPITERPVDNNQRKAPLQQNQQWYPEYSFGGQNLLKLTDVEKIEELKNYTLFDLVTPLLIGDEDNLLALQNKIQENRRFTNTYANPKPERPLQPPKNIEQWRQHMMNVYPTPYPMSLDQPQAQLYYDDWNNQDYQYLNKKLDMIAQGGNFNPDIQKVLNSKRHGYTAVDRRVVDHGEGAKMSLLENIDSSSITALDLMMLR